MGINHRLYSKWIAGNYRSVGWRLWIFSEHARTICRVKVQLSGSQKQQQSYLKRTQCFQQFIFHWVHCFGCNSISSNWHIKTRSSALPAPMCTSLLLHSFVLNTLMAFPKRKINRDITARRSVYLYFSRQPESGGFFLLLFRTCSCKWTRANGPVCIWEIAKEDFPRRTGT